MRLILPTRVCERERLLRIVYLWVWERESLLRIVYPGDGEGCAQRGAYYLPGYVEKEDNSAHTTVP